MSDSFFSSQKSHKFWLKITAVVVGSFAPVFFLGTMAETSEPARWTLDFISWPLDGSVTYDSSGIHLLSALAGGFLLGWGVMIWLLSVWIYDKAPEATRKIVLISLISWFVLDTTGSVASGNAYNALFNSIILLIAVGPLWFSAKE